MKIIILGGDGMLGHKMFQVVSNRFDEVFCTLHGNIDDEVHHKIALFQQGNVIENFDAMNFHQVQDTLGDLHPDYIINCIGIIKQRSESKDYILSITINSLLPHKLAKLCETWGGRLIHFGTDCVFSGKKGAYLEEDLSDAEDLYGRTKFLGEVNSANSLVLRTSIIGRELRHFQSLLEWFLRQNHQKVYGFKRAWYSGVTNNYLAELVVNIMINFPRLTGLYQVTGQTISKFDLLCLLRQAFNLDIEVQPEENFFCNRSMKGDKFGQATGLQCPSWPELVAQLALDPTPYEQWR
jgi:dTDP-4-dehydrorhamnose reductase